MPIVLACLALAGRDSTTNRPEEGQSLSITDGDVNRARIFAETDRALVAAVTDPSTVCWADPGRSRPIQADG
jgi:hypothetical protein